MSPFWKVSGTLHEVRLGACRRRVFRVRWSSPRAVLAEAHRGWAYDMYVDRAAARDVIAAWCLAARSPHSLVWLPMRAHTWPCGRDADTVDRPLDLVLVRSGVQFPVHEWKRLRSVLGAGRPMAARVPRHEFPARAHVDWGATYFRGCRDHLRFDQAAETLFVAGTRIAFDLAGTQLMELETEAPGYTATHPDYHYCVEIARHSTWGHSRHRRDDGPGELHIEYSPRWRAS